MKKYINRVLSMFISILDILIPKDKNIVVFNSYPDFSDNSFAVFIHLLKTNRLKKKIWLVKGKKNEQYKRMISSYCMSDNYKIIQRDSLKGMYFYLRAKYVFFTHGIYGTSKISKKHIVVNVWHGMPLKKIGALEGGKVPRNAKYAIATSSLFQSIMAKAFCLNINNVKVVGQPRYDLMFQNHNCLEKLEVDRSKFKAIALWTPTYRHSYEGDVRVDSNSENSLGVLKLDKFEEFNTFLVSIGLMLIIKLHPMDKLNSKKIKNKTNIKVLKKNDLQLVNCQLNSLLGEIDILLTDISSVYIDFLMLNRPIGFVFEDFEEYEQSRGFVFENIKEYMPGEMVYSLKGLKAFLKSIVILKQDKYINERTKLNKVFNESSNNSSEELLKIIKMK